MPDRLNLQKIFSAPDVKHGRQLPTEDLNKLKNLQVPILFKKVQQEISSLIEQSHETKQRARELWEEAKRKVEKAIENEIRK